MSEGYVVEIKASARRTNGAAGTAVNREGVRREFDDRDDAESWAADLARRGERSVWVRDANPNDERDVDAYLMGRLRRPGRGRRPGDGGSGDSRDQSSMVAYARDEIQ